MGTKQTFRGSYPKARKNSRRVRGTPNVSEQRKTIKLYLQNIGDKCPICGLLLSNGFHLHEAIITRGMVRGVSHLLPEIMVLENCVGVHGDCHVDAHTTEGRKKCAEHLVKRETMDSVSRWIDRMESKLKSKTLINECRSLL